MKGCAKTLLAALLAALLLFSGCSGIKSIREDSVQENLPQIDPEAGTARDFTTTMYYWLSNEPYLVPIRHSVTVGSNETPEDAIVRTLLSDVPPLAENVSNAFPEGTETLDIARDGSILYITLSEEYLDDSALRAETEAADRLLSEGDITQEMRDGRVAAAAEALYVRRRAGLYAIVNSLTAYDPSVRVMLSVNRRGVGAERLRYDEIGIVNTGEAASSLLEPLEFQGNVLVTPERIVECVLRRMQAGELALVYDLFAETESGAGQKPAYAEFEAQLNSLGRLAGYTVHDSVNQTANAAYVNVDTEFVDAQGAACRLTGVQLALKSEGNIYRLSFYAFLEALGATA
jgi:lipoprotein